MKKIFLIILITLSLIPNLSHVMAQNPPVNPNDYKLLEPLPCIEGVGNCVSGTIQKTININDYILYVYKFSIAFAVFLAIIMIIWGGFLYMTSEVPFIKSDGKSKIQSAITGLVLVLVSYLILLTIDPRLVNVDSTIQPITYTKADLQASKDFQSTLASDLKNLSIENQAKFKEINNNIVVAQEEKKKLDDKVAAGIVTKEQAAIEYQNISKDLAQYSVENYALIAEGNGATSFSRSLEYIQDPNNTNDANLEQYTAQPLPNPSGSTPRPTNSPNIIQNQYNEKINKILATNSNFDKIQVLEKQRDFYIAQVKEEQSLKELIDVTDLTPVEKKLPEKVVAYTADLKDTTKQVNSGLSPDVYNKIIQNRIDVLNNAIEKTN